MKLPLLTIAVRTEPDVVLARQRARLLAELMGFDLQDQTRIATAISELARNLFQYAGGGRVQFCCDRADGDALEVEVADRGPGIPNLEQILSGDYKSKTGMGVGLRGAKKLMDAFDIQTSTAGTTIRFKKRRPLHGHAVDPVKIAKGVAAREAASPFEEVRLQNQDLLRALEELKTREEQLVQLNRQLSDTNSGILSLYNELEEKAAALRASNELKARFHSQMTHEVRTPVNSILSISELLLNGTVAPPLDAQAKPLGFIHTAAQQLSQLVSDLLDMAKVESGMMTLRLGEFAVTDLFAGLRGMFRPLHSNPRVALIFGDVAGVPVARSDEGKIGQVLRNFISNALKFTTVGEVRVEALMDGPNLVFTVRDTGIGIARENQARVFEDFIQIESSLQRNFTGTGLGLALSRDLATLLGGGISLESEEGRGSTFRLSVPHWLAPNPMVSACTN